MLYMLLSCAGVTTIHILLDKGSDARPPVLPFNSLEGSMDAGVTRGGIVVALLENVAAKLVVGWDVDTPLIVHQTVFFFPFSKTVDETTRTGCAKLGKSFQNVSFTGAGVADTLLQGIDDHVSGGDLGKVLRFEDDLLLVVFGVGDLVNVEA